MRLYALPAAALVAALVLVGCAKPADHAQAQAQADDPAYRAQVVAYLLKHPDVIEEAADRYQSQQHVQAVAAASKAIPSRRAALEHDPRDFVANPDGKITVVEFFDYRCPYCKAALPALEDLIRTNKDVRFVFKEFPILPDANGQIGVSLRAARAAMAAGRDGKYVQVHDALMSQKPLDDAGIARVLKENGVDPNQAAATPDVDRHIKDVQDLAVAIGATGTPSFVVGDTLVEGARMDELSQAIAQARKSAKG
jgi:protein-disulfide isomerase